MSDFVQEEEEEEVSFKEKIINLRMLWIVLAVLSVTGIIIGIILYSIFGRFDTYSITSEVDLESSSQSQYKEFSKGILAYSKDGASYRTFRGDIVWADTYDMQSPTAVISGDELLIYDKSGTRLTVMTESGSQGEISTTLPIVRADIARNGMVAVLMQDKETGYLNVYEADGGLVAGGQVHMEKTGYPVAIAISPDGTRLAVSMISISEGSSSTQITFYDFGKTGSTAKDNIIATFNYLNSVFPEIDYMEDGRLVAFSSKEVMVFSASAKKPEAEKRISPDGEIRSVVAGDSTFGVVTKGIDGVNVLTEYSSSGSPKFEKKIKLDYSRLNILSNKDILITDGEEVILYNKYGTKRFHYNFSDGIVAMIPGSGMRDYILVEKGKLKRITLK